MSEIAQIHILISSLIRLHTWGPVCPVAPYWRFYWNSIAGARVCVGSVEYKLEPEYFYIIPAGTEFRAALDNQILHLNCNFIFPDEFVFLDAGVYPLKASCEQLAWANECQEIVLSARELDFSTEFRRRLLMQQMVSYCCCRLPLTCMVTGSGNERIDAVLQYIRTSMNRKKMTALDNNSLASVACMHRNSFTRLFRKCTGTSPQSYVAENKIDISCIMLHDQAYTIEEISFRLGYCDRYHFSREFKKRMGMSPASFRKSLRYGH